MGEELTAEEARRATFDAALRGYDRDAVDRFRDRVADRIRQLEDRVGDLEGRFEQMGITELPDLQAELDAVGGDIKALLEAARRAAVDMRERAVADAARWRAEADDESRRRLRDAQSQAEAARKDAWDSSATLLEQSETESRRLIDTAEQDALFIRAEAEREALRLTGDARRDAEEALSAAASESERMLVSAHAESESILSTARRSAELAQERARALEQRRVELLDELEGARRTIGGLHTTSSAGAAESGPPFDPDADGRWMDEDGTVRIVPAPEMLVDEPVDADSLVAEVERLRHAAEPVAGPIESEPAPPVDAAPEDATFEGDVEAAPPVEPEQVEPDLPDEVSREPVDELEITEEPVADEPVAEEPVAEEPVAEEPAAEPEGPEPEPESSVLDELFAKLRSPPEPPPTPEPEPEPEPGPEPEPVAAPSPEVVPLAGSLDPFELKARVLLPVENRTLRPVKRRILDLQNRVLEELRVGGDQWSPDRAMFAAAMGDDVGRLAQESYVAGFTAAAELTGRSADVRPEGAPSQASAAVFEDDLHAAVIDAHRRAVAGGGGARQLSAAVSRVFRAWRTDEAERRVRHTAGLAYHEGLLAGFRSLGVERVTAIAPGQPCGMCPAGLSQSWTPGDPLPAGRSLPPAGPACNATIVPVV